MRVLITGVTGFAGGHLAEALAERTDVELFGAARNGEWPADLRHLAERVRLLRADLADPQSARELIRTVRPERIFHVAGYAHVGRSFTEVEAAWAGNLTATRHLYEAVRLEGLKPRIVYASSSHVYGDPDDAAQTFDESSPLRPTSPYAASKAAADLMSYQYTVAPGLEIIRARPLNHIGPRQSPQYALAGFASQIAAIERGQQTPIVETGNLTPCRDLTDVRDVAHAYVLLMERGRSGEAYNIASGVVVSMQEVLDRLRAQAQVPIEVRPRADRMRSVDALAIRPRADKLRRELGWEPRCSLERSLADLLAYWRRPSDLSRSSSPA